ACDHPSGRSGASGRPAGRVVTVTLGPGDGHRPAGAGPAAAPRGWIRAIRTRPRSTGLTGGDAWPPAGAVPASWPRGRRRRPGSQRMRRIRCRMLARDGRTGVASARLRRGFESEEADKAAEHVVEERLDVVDGEVEVFVHGHGEHAVDLPPAGDDQVADPDGEIRGDRVPVGL